MKGERNSYRGRLRQNIGMLQKSMIEILVYPHVKVRPAGLQLSFRPQVGIAPPYRGYRLLAAGDLFAA